jgi:hypothetical protein
MTLKEKFQLWLKKQEPPRMPSGIACDLVDFIDFLDQNYTLKLKTKKRRSPSAEVWDAYADAFVIRYKRLPVRNAMVNGQLAQLVARVGAGDAKELVRFYVLRANDSYYTRNYHSIGALLHGCEGMMVRMSTGRHVTQRQAQRLEDADATAQASRQYLEEKHGGNQTNCS